GTMTACSVPVHFHSAISMNIGTMPSWVGIAMVAITVSSRPVRPRKRSFANAYPASVEKNTTEMVIAPEMMTLFSSASRNGTVSKTFSALLRKFGPGSTAGGTRFVSDDWRLEITNEHHSGKAEPAKKADRKSTRLN